MRIGFFATLIMRNVQYFVFSLGYSASEFASPEYRIIF